MRSWTARTSRDRIAHVTPLRAIALQREKPHTKLIRRGKGTGAVQPRTLEIEEWKRWLLGEALRETGGNKTRAAKLLGISMRGLEKMLVRSNEP